MRAKNILKATDIARCWLPAGRHVAFYNVVAVLLLLSSGSGQPRIGQSPPVRPVPVSSNTIDAEAAQAARLGASTVLGHFQPSLEMKESADFIVTPAVLVQESISDSVIPTYPTE